MARARLLKPGFFANADLARVPAHGRLLFAGLWTIADKAGRLKDDPLYIKGQVFPFEDVDCEPWLAALQSGGFLRRYVINRARYIQIVNWERHQHPHVNEVESCIPESKKHQSRTANGASASSNGGSTRAVSKSVAESDPKAIAVAESVTVAATAPNGSGPTSGAPVSLSGSSPTDLPMPGDYAFARELWINGIGQLTTDITRTLREDLAYNAPWCISAIQETAAAPKPSYEYYVAIIQRCRDDKKPPASYAKSHR